MKKNAETVLSSPVSPKQKGLTEEFLKALDEEFYKQRNLFNYDFEPSVHNSNDSLSQSSTSQHETSGPIPSWFEIEKNSNLIKPEIPKWDVVLPKLDKLDKLLKQRKEKLLQNNNTVSSNDVHEKANMMAMSLKRNKISKKLVSMFQSGWTMDKGSKNQSTDDLHSEFSTFDADVSKWAERLQKGKSQFRQYLVQDNTRAKSGRGMNIQFGASCRYPKETNQKSSTSTGSPISRSKYNPVLPAPRDVTFISDERTHPERPRSPGPIYNTDIVRKPRGLNFSAQVRSINGSIYEIGFSNASPGPAYNIQNDFYTSSRYLSATPPKFARDPQLTTVGVIEQKIINRLNPLSPSR